jgi:LPXTG-motif cell wall-anchored protein
VPELGGFVVRKVLDAADVQGTRDMSGFEFEIGRAPNDVVARLVTGADGRTPVFEAQPGTYTIAEIARPTWATRLIDPGPITHELAPDDGTESRQIDYVNVVPEAMITTAARDAHDGDRLVVLDAGNATIVDSVDYTALVPDTEYVASGELMVRATESIGSGADTPMIPTGIIGSTTFVPDRPDGSVEVAFTVPADSPLRGHVVVVYQQLAVAASGRIVALHNDLDAVEQTIRFADAATTTTTAAVTTTTTGAPATTIEPVATIATATTTNAATPAPSTSPPPPSSPLPPPPAPTRTALPRTGTSGVQATALAGVALAVLGLTLLATIGRRRPPRSTP